MALKDWKKMKSSREPQWLNTVSVKHQGLWIQEIGFKKYRILINGKTYKNHTSKLLALKSAKAYMRKH